MTATNVYPLGTARSGAYRKGFEHALAGGSLRDCPYDDRVTRPRPDWNRGFANAWREGFHDGSAARKRQGRLFR
jgi:ribosome modulation factor